VTPNISCATYPLVVPPQIMVYPLSLASFISFIAATPFAMSLLDSEGINVNAAFIFMPPLLRFSYHAHPDNY
jgi:hypothetical protein